MNKMKLNHELLLTMAVMALVGALGIVAFFCSMFGIDIYQVGMATISGIVFGLTGILFALFLLNNIDR